MVFIVDDLLYALTINPWIFMIELVHNCALKEMYPLDKLNDALKENRLVYEFGEMTTEKYEKRQKELLEKIEVAKKVREMDFGARLDILGIGGLA